MTGFIPVDKYSLPQLALVNYSDRDLGNVRGPDFASANLISQPVSLSSSEIFFFLFLSILKNSFWDVVGK